MEIERKYLVNSVPEHLPITNMRLIEQGYLNTEPVVRIRKDNDNYELTYKSKGLMVREEHNMPLTKEAYEHLKTKVDGRIISKTRYEIPLNEELKIELDVFHGGLEPLILAEVEFPTVEEAESFTPPEWFGADVTYDSRYHNSVLSQK